MNCETRTRLGIGLLAFLLIAGTIMLAPFPAHSVTGVCSNCHTMHNSQNGSPMVGYSSESWAATGEQGSLLRGSCLGCHGMNTSASVETLPPEGGPSPSYVPQVYHQNNGDDLAGGNFTYIGISDAKGHNIVELGNVDDVFILPKGSPPQIQPPGAEHLITDMPPTLTCAGNNGCHGLRDNDGPSDIAGIKGAHHSNAGPQIDVADTVGNSYRFLYGVRGYENNADPLNTAWRNTTNPNFHNEYLATTTPMDITALGCDACHPPTEFNNIKPENNTISGFCATCHGLFHDAAEMGTSGAFKRHPNDIEIQNAGEFASPNFIDTNWNSDAPVGRTVQPIGISPTYNTGDAVICLSCHAAHATENDDMLRWDYATIQTGGSGGCLICHTSK